MAQNYAQQIASIQKTVERIQALNCGFPRRAISFEEGISRIGWSKSYAYQNIDKLPHYKPFGKKIYFDAVELDDWLLKNRISTDEELEQKAANEISKRK